VGVFVVPHTRDSGSTAAGDAHVTADGAAAAAAAGDGGGGGGAAAVGVDSGDAKVKVEVGVEVDEGGDVPEAGSTAGSAEPMATSAAHGRGNDDTGGSGSGSGSGGRKSDTDAAAVVVPCRYCNRVGGPSEYLAHCSVCKQGYHSGCMEPGHEPKAPRDGAALTRWSCMYCKYCHSCKTMKPTSSGWFDVEHLVGEKKVALSFCGPCHARYKRREYCPICVQTYTADAINMLGCDACDVRCVSHHAAS